MQKEGQIGVTTENIFPIIKKYLYSDHEIFLREVISNAIDATQKLKTLADKGNSKENSVIFPYGFPLTRRQKPDHFRSWNRYDRKELDKYINQIALSSANEFLEKYKDSANAIIGHFGLSFYSTYGFQK